jgi:2-polyprenyl-3-methyl-5-hydroxy-6-metoxy-1,4-benzoquinol methylase
MNDRTGAAALKSFYGRSSLPAVNDPLYVLFYIKKRRQILKFIRRALARLPSHNIVRILDVGCGDGGDLDYVIASLAQGRPVPELARNYRFHALDAFQEHIDMLRARCESLGLSADVLVHDLTEGLPYDAETFHIVICSEVVEHLEFPEAVIHEIHRVLAPGGYLILTTDNTPTVLSVLKDGLISWKSRAPIPRDVYRRTGAKEVAGKAVVDGSERALYGHINTRRTREWEAACRQEGFTVAEYGDYDAVRRNSKSDSPVALAIALVMGAVVSLLPARIGRYIDPSTFLLLRKPA